MANIVNVFRDNFRAYYKLNVFSIHLLNAALLYLCMFPIKKFNPSLEKKLLKIFTMWWFKSIETVLGIKVRSFGLPCEAPSFIVANHVSWIDLIVIGSRVPGYFIAADFVLKIPVLGWVFENVGRVLALKKWDIPDATRLSAVVESKLDSGDNIIVFPEGLTTEGYNMEKFHSRFFQCAVNCEVPVQPIAIYYPGDEQGWNLNVTFPVNKSYFSSVWKSLKEKTTIVVLDFCKPITVKNGDRKYLTNHSKTAIEASLKVHTTFSKKYLNSK
jgi:1-acyl-sn-glycerol-3-phosphate acyltransferase